MINNKDYNKQKANYTDLFPQTTQNKQKKEQASILPAPRKTQP